jgi:hypothetical protein
MNAPQTDTLHCDDAGDLLPAYALDALEPEEMQAVRVHLATCPRCRAELADYDQVVDALGAVAPVASPPSALRSRLLTSAASMSPPARPQPHPVSSITMKHSSSRMRVVTFGLAAAAVVLLAATVVLATLLRDATDQRDQAVNGQQAFVTYLSSGGQVESRTGLSASDNGTTQGRARLLTAPGKPPMVIVGDCPPTTKDRVYRVWLAQDGKRTPLGELDVTTQGNGWYTIEIPASVTTFDTVGITMVTNNTSRSDLFTAPLSPSTS